MVTVLAVSSVVILISNSNLVIEYFPFRNPDVALFFQRVRGVGNQLANENLLIGVKRMDDDIQ